MGDESYIHSDFLHKDVFWALMQGRGDQAMKNDLNGQRKQN